MNNDKLKIVAAISVAATLILFTALWLTTVARTGIQWGFIYNMAQGLAVPHDAPALAGFRNAVIDGCGGLDECILHAGATAVEIPFNYPIPAATYLMLANAAPGEAFWPVAAGAAAAGILLGYLVSLTIVFVSGTALSVIERLTISVVFFVAGLVALAPRQGAPIPDFLHMTTPRPLAAMLVLTCAVFALGSRPAVRSAVRNLLDRLARNDWLIYLACLSLVALVLIPLRFELPRVYVAVPALLGFGIVYTVAAANKDIEWKSAIIIGIGIVLLSSSTRMFIGTTYADPKAYFALAASIWLVAVYRNPNGRLVWLLPFFAIFHVGVVGLFALVLLTAEIWVAFFRRKVTRLSMAAAIAALGSIVIAALGYKGMGVSRESIEAAFHAITSKTFAPVFVVILALLAMSAWLLLQRQWDQVSRALFIAAELAFFGQLSGTLRTEGIPQFQEGFFIFNNAPVYLGPALATGAILILLSAFATYPGKGVSSAGHGSRVLMLSLTAAAFIVVAKSPVGGLLPLDVRLGLLTLHDPARHPPAEESLEQLFRVKFDDTYLMPRGDIRFSELRFLEYLKLRDRLRKGLVDERQVRFVFVN